MFDNVILVVVKDKQQNLYCIDKYECEDIIKNLNDDDKVKSLLAYKVELEYLKENFNSLDPDTFPQIYINLDSKKIISFYKEMDFAYQDCAPDNFESDYNDFYHLIDENLKYWIKK